MIEYVYRSGGLMRCCIATLDNRAKDGTLPSCQGSILNCDYCTSQVIYIDNAWEWLNPRDKEGDDERGAERPCESTEEKRSD